jgi:U4/U6 small nuclear ribonucleoprotein PRP31
MKGYDLSEQFMKDFEEEPVEPAPVEQLERSEQHNPLEEEIRKCTMNSQILTALALVEQNRNKQESVGFDFSEVHICLGAIELIEINIGQLFKLLLGTYQQIFPELEHLVTNAVTYCSIAIYLAHNGGQGFTGFLQLLDKQLSIPVSVAFSKRIDRINNSKDSLGIGERVASAIMTLEENKGNILEYITTRTERIAPNVFHLIGGKLTAVLLSRTGGIKELAMTPACNIQLIGEEKKNLMGLSKHGKKLHLGCFKDHPLVQATSDEFQTKLVKLLANGVAKVSRIDSVGLSSAGEIGKCMYQDIIQKFEKYQLPKSGQMRQPLPAPEEAPKRRRGGKKFRRMNERLGMTEAGKLRNQMKFGTDFSEEVINQTEGLGMLTQSNIGRLKVNRKIEKYKLNKGQKQRQQHQVHRTDLSGLTSKLTFTHAEGIELVNPALRSKRPGIDTSNLENLGFKSVIDSRNKRT